MHMCARHEVFLIRPVARRTVHKLRCRMMQDANDDTRQTIHDCIGSFLPNEPISFSYL